MCQNPDSRTGVLSVLLSIFESEHRGIDRQYGLDGLYDGIIRCLF